MAKLFIPKRLFSAHEKRLLWLYYHSPILLLGFSYDAYMMRI